MHERKNRSSLKKRVLTTTMIMTVLSPLSTAGDLTVVGKIESQSGGFVFPDGTVQLSAEGPTAVDPPIVIGELLLDGPVGASSYEVYGLELEWQRSYGAPPVFYGILVRLAAKQASPLLFRHLAEGVRYETAAIDLNGVNVTLSGGLTLSSHSQAVSREPYYLPRYVELLLKPDRVFEINTDPEFGEAETGWDVLLQQQTSGTCDNENRRYIVGPALQEEDDIDSEFFQYWINLNGAQTVFHPLALSMKNEHREGVCLLEHLFSGSGPEEINAIATKWDKFSINSIPDYWYRLVKPFVLNPVVSETRWNFSVVRPDSLKFTVEIPYSQSVCHGYYDSEVGQSEECVDVTLNPP